MYILGTNIIGNRASGMFRSSLSTPPTNLRVVSISLDSIEVQWDYGSKFNEVYEVENDSILIGTTAIAEKTYIDVLNDAIYNRLLSTYDNTLGNYTGDVSIWLKGSGDSIITWNTGITQTVTLTGTLTEYSHSYVDENPTIYITNALSTTEMLLDLTEEFIIQLTDINVFNALTLFYNIDSTIEGVISTLNISTLKHLNLGYQVGNTNLTGDIGILLNNSLFTLLTINGGDLTYSTQLTQIESGAEIILDDTVITNAEIDSILIDSELLGTDPFTIRIIGDNGNRTATSNSAYSQLITNGSTIELNGIPLTSLSYTNSGQTFTESVAITTMSLVTVDDPTPYSYLESFGTLPSGLSFNTSTGDITGTPAAATAGNYVFSVREIATSLGSYTGFVETTLSITVAVGVVSKTYNVNLCSANTILNTDDPNSKYWNDLLGVSGSVVNIIDEDNGASAITVAITDAFDAVSDFNGRQPTDGVYPNKAWRSVMDISSGSGVITISGLPNSSYNITVGASRNTTGARIAKYTIGATDLTLDGILNPPQTVTFTGIVPSSGTIVLTTTINAGSIAAHIGFIKIIG